MEDEIDKTEEEVVWIRKCAGEFNRLRIALVTRRYWMARLLASRVLLIVSITLDHPVPGFEGLLATGSVFLGDERHLVLGDLAQILASVAYCLCYCGEANASEQLIRAWTRAALHFLTHVQAVTVRVGGSCFSVRFLKKAAR